MLLAIDVGNTNTVFALFQNDEINHSWRCQTEKSRSVDEYAVFLNQLFELENIQWSDITDVIISSVVPDANFHLTLFTEKYINSKPIFVQPENVDLKIDLDQPDEIGADRMVNAVAVRTHYQCPAIVIDFGTATTFDVIAEDGTYLGGVIAPGIRLSAHALTTHTAKLPEINIEVPEKIIGKNTKNAMKAGMYWGYLGLLETIIDRIKEELGSKDITVIATGGLASLYAENTTRIDHVDENLILKGLLTIYKNSKEKA